MTMPTITVFGNAAIALLLSLYVVSSPLASQASGGPRDATHLVYDSGQRQLLLLASSRESGQEEIWRWDASRWTRVPGSGPPARHLGAAAYDTRRRRLVLQGGMAPSPGNDRKGDTWEWDGTTWQSISATSIGPRDHHAMAYDEARGRMVLFGGGSSNEEFAADTWEYDGTTWTRVAADGPPGRAHFGMAYDATSQRVIIFGGLTRTTAKSYRAANDTWAWDGKTWQQLSDSGPSPRTHIRMAFDRRTKKIVVFGGQANGRPTASLGDTWTWDGQRWTEIKAAGPTPRSWHLMAFDESLGRTILYGGSVFDGKVSTSYDDTWAWDGEGWMLLTR